MFPCIMIMYPPGKTLWLRTTATEQSTEWPLSRSAPSSMLLHRFITKLNRFSTKLNALAKVLFQHYDLHTIELNAHSYCDLREIGF